MSTFGRLVGGFALDCQVASSLDEIATRYNAEWLERNPFSQVPDGTLHGAKDNGDGTFTPPAVAPSNKVDAVLPRADFITYSVEQLGSSARFGASIAAARSAIDGAVIADYELYSASSFVTKDQAVTFYADLRSASLPSGATITTNEIDAVTSNWPQV